LYGQDPGFRDQRQQWPTPIGVGYRVKTMTGIETPSNRIRLQPGDRVGDHLVVRSVLGQGGTAVVYEALHTRLGASVALKVLDVPESFRYDGVLRMQREAEVCASIEDPHVPRIYDINALPDGTPYVVMEKVAGTTLEAMLAAGTLMFDEVLSIADDLLAALEAVHRAGVIHRDIKPANLILQRESDGSYRVRLMDFGVSKALFSETTDPKLTRVGTVVGTPHYMAPEQITGEAVDARADVYATGVVLFEMLSGRMPFEGESTAEVVAAVLRHNPVPLASLRPEVPRSLENVVMRAMSPRPNDRFLTVRDMRAALADCNAPTRTSALSLVPVPRGFSVAPERISSPRFDSEFGARPASYAREHQARPAATRRYSILGAGLAVLLGTVGFPRAAKHVSVEVAPAQVAKAEVEAPATPAGALEPARVSDNALVGEAPRYRLELPSQRLEIAVSPESDPQADATPEDTQPQPPVDELAVGASVREQEREEERRAVRDEERHARRRLREAEAAMEQEEELDPGVLISDYVRQIEAIQREAEDHGSTLPGKAVDVAPAPVDDSPLPPNPYPN
jgi:serine/threonine protein kinase